MVSCFASQGSNRELQLSIEKFIPKLEEESVIAVYRDSEGYLWVATYAGLYRSDGTDHHVFLNNPDDKYSINSSVVFTIFEDSKNNLWMGTQKGLDQYNRETGNFIHHIPSSPDDLYTYKEIRDIAEDNAGNLWLASYNHSGLIKYNPSTKEEKTYWLPDYEEQRLNTLEIDNNKLWIGTELNGLYLLHVDTESFENIINHTNANPITINDIKIVDGVLWIGTWNNGLMSYNPENHKTIWHHKNMPYSGHFSGHTVRQITVDPQKNLWLASFGNGIDYFDVHHKTVMQVTNKNEFNLSYKSPLSWCIFIDKQDILWLGAHGGGLSKVFINEAKQELLSFEHKGSQIKVRNIHGALQDADDHLWIGTKNQGLIKYNMDLKMGRRIRLDATSEVLLIINLMMDKLGRLWVGTDQGIYILNPKTNVVISHIHRNNSFLKEIEIPTNLFYSDLDGDVWISAWQAGLFHIPFSQIENNNPEEYAPNRYLVDTLNNESLLHNNITGVFQSSDGTVWISGTYFMQKFSKTSQTFTHFSWFDGPDIIEDKNNHLWISSNVHGIIDYDSEQNKTTVFGANAPGKSNALDIFSDSSHIWLNRKNELLRINCTNHQVDYFRADAGFIKMKYTNSSLALSNNKVFLAGDAGCYIYEPSEEIPTSITQIRPSHLFFFNKKVAVNDTIDGHIVLKKKLGAETRLIIPASVNSFSIEFSSIDFIKPQETLYAYKLEGFDTTWTYLDYPNRSAIFTNLDGGEYTLHMNIVNPFVDWKNNAQILRIKVLIPYYKTTWFRILSTILIAALIILFFILRQQRLNKINVELETTVALRTKELKMMNTELVNQTQQLNKMNGELLVKQKFINEQSEEINTQKNKLQISNTELIELNATKDKFFSIIAHDLRSPFNTILGFLELLHDGYATYSDEERKKMIENSFDSSKVVYHLVENLLCWALSKNGTIAFNPKPINIHNLVNQTVDVALINSQKKEIDICYTPVDTAIFITADSNMLNFVLRNLLTNAIKFTQNKGQVTIDVRQENNTHVFCVSDTGVGMNKQTIQDLFQIAKQKSTPGTQNEKGTGLGLILCKDFVDRHKGKIWIESEVNKGSSIYFSIPNKLT